MGNSIDLTGQTFARLTVLRRAANRGRFTCWLCRCVCGKVTEVRGRALIGGTTRSCGCLKNEAIAKRKHDLTGRTFGRLTVIGSAVDRLKANGNYCWRCRRRCGNIVKIRGADLTTGDTRSCGCLYTVAAKKRERRKRRATATRPNR